MRAWTLAAVGLAAGLLWASGVSAQAELTGTYIRYLRVGANGALVDVPGMRSMQYSEAGMAAGATCDLYYPGSPAVGFTVRATPAAGVAAAASNNSARTDVTRVSGPTLSGRAIDWSGRWTSGAIDVTVDQRAEYAIGDRYARLTVTLTNVGTTRLDDVYYFLSGDPDHGQCNIGTTFETNNDVVRQFPADTSALATATAGAPAVVFGIGTPDARARANNGGFENVDALAAWNTPVDSAGALLDQDIGMAFREPSLAAGASTTFVMYLVWATTAADVGTRLDAAIAADAELAGTYIRYLRLGGNGALIDASLLRSMQYSELGGATDLSCDLYSPGSPAAGFTLSATSGATTVTASNNDLTTGVTRRSGPHTAGRTLRWTGNWASGAVNLDVEQVYQYAVGARVADVTVRLTNRGVSSLTNVEYFFSGDPDHGQCSIGSAFETNNDVLRQRPTEGWAISTAGAGGATRYYLGLGSTDSRARANNGGFRNTAADAAFTTPVDSNNALLDEDIGLVFREPTLAAGASTTFTMRIAWGTSQTSVEARLTGLAPNGTACASGTTCASAYCVDGVCCDSACAGGTSDCQACAVSAGATVNGTCAPLVAGTVCRASAGACDAAETCSGVSAACPANGLAPAGTICRATAGPCDAAETCTGASATCPADAFLGAATVCRSTAGSCDVAETCSGASAACPADGFSPVTAVCRPSAGTCDVVENCNGTGALCPADAFSPATTVCRASTGACDVAERCTGTGASCPANASAPDGTSCSDGVGCNGAEACMTGTCRAGMSLSCDDLNACTADTCSEPGTCGHTAIAGCCTMASDCDDMNACTSDSCVASACAHTVIMGCGGIDAGMVATDAGTPATDAGTPATDAGTMDVDAGTMDVDAGTMDVDAGAMDVDAGTVDLDAATDLDAAVDVDASAELDGATDASPSDDGSAASTDGSVRPIGHVADAGCGCHTTSPTRSPVGLLVTLALLATAAIRRRRRR